MTPPLFEATVRLAETLAQENALLRTMDLAGAAALVRTKAEAVTSFESALAARPGVTTRLRDAVARLRSEVEDNRRLLLRAMTVQKRIIGIVAGAAKPKPEGRYARSGAYAAARPTGFALSARA